MTIKQLSHPFTPPPLQKLNAALEDLIAQDEFDEAHLLQLIEQRDEFINTYLKTLTGNDLKNFAQAEMSVNDWLTEFSNEQLSAALTRLSGLLKGRKAIEKYK